MAAHALHNCTQGSCARPMESRTTFSLEVNPRHPAPPRAPGGARRQPLVQLGSARRARCSRGCIPGCGTRSATTRRRSSSASTSRSCIDAADDPVFLGNFNRVLSAYDTYHNEPLRRNGSEWLRSTDLVAYFCAEFGFHESLPIYSGGLGILAGDHCKAASDMRLPFVGVGLLYRQGYFPQTIDARGQPARRVHATRISTTCRSTPVQRADGSEVRVDVDLPGRRVIVQGVARALRPRELVPARHRSRRRTTSTTATSPTSSTAATARRASSRRSCSASAACARSPRSSSSPRSGTSTKATPRSWSSSACARWSSQGLDFPTRRWKPSPANTVFTTHTPVPAGHDHFADDTIVELLQRLLPGAEAQPRASSSRSGARRRRHDFNMTALAIRGSRFQNGVSRIHGGVSSRICCAAVAADRPARKTRIGYVTNGVHVPTFLAPEWAELFEKYLGFDWTQRLTDPGFWQRMRRRSPTICSGACASRSRRRCCIWCATASRVQHFRNHGSRGAPRPAAASYADPVNPNVLTIGFARRFATYKRATLLFQDLDWLRADLRATTSGPVLFLFAGKAHPADEPGPGADPPHRRRSRACRSSRATSCWSKTTTCTSRAGWSPAWTCGSTIRSIRWRRAAPRA